MGTETASMIDLHEIGRPWRYRGCLFRLTDVLDAEHPGQNVRLVFTMQRPGEYDLGYRRTIVCELIDYERLPLPHREAEGEQRLASAAPRGMGFIDAERAAQMGRGIQPDDRDYESPSSTDEEQREEEFDGNFMHLDDFPFLEILALGDNASAQAPGQASEGGFELPVEADTAPTEVEADIAPTELDSDSSTVPGEA